MGILSRWVKHSSPLVKVTMAIAVTSGLILNYKMFYAPYVRRKRLLEAEEWANAIIEQEEKMKEYENS